jgi:CRISPR/Cas system endoribonuclease Cas6 (RAMP superfamily)
MAVMRDKKAIGFTGYVTYELKDKGKQWNKTTHMLARYAEYANIGGNKTDYESKVEP